MSNGNEEAGGLEAKAEVLVEEAEELIDEIVDLEQCAKLGQKPPLAKGYRFRVNDQLCIWDKPTITGEEVLTLAKLVPPGDYRLRLKVAGAKPEPIELTTVVDLRRHGVEKFRAIKNGQSEGEAQGRRQTPALEQDEAFLNSYGLPWEIIADGSIWVLLHNFPIPAGYNVSAVSLAIRMEGGYPITALDMMYVYPALTRLDGRPIPQAQVVQVIDGKPFQRWSRHRTAANPWTPGLDSLETHIYLVEEFFGAELRK
jgi:hypothetical protein